MNQYCAEHKDHTNRIERLETELDKQRDKDDSLATKLNIILGGIIISPFLVALIQLLVISKSN